MQEETNPTPPEIQQHIDNGGGIILRSNNEMSIESIINDLQTPSCIDLEDISTKFTQELSRQIENLPFSQSLLFNPSIAHWKDDLYILTCRAFQRYPNQSVTVDKQYENIPFNHPNHPWLGGKNGLLWWKADFDNTLVYTYNCRSGDVEYINWIEGVDARILRDERGGGFLIYTNSYTRNVSNTHLNKDYCRNTGCFVFKIFILDMDPIRRIRQVDFCHNISKAGNEKNWCVFDYNNELILLYGLINNSKIYKLQWVNNEKKEIICSDHYLTIDTTWFDNLETIYKIGSLKILDISCSTPAIPFKKEDRFTYFFSCGHYKYKYDYLSNSMMMNELPLFEFNEIMMSKYSIKHPVLIYLIFFFIFKIGPDNKLTMEYISPGIHPRKIKFPLIFPSGIEIVNDGIYLTCGLYDQKSIIYKFGLDILEKRGYPSNPRDYQFIEVDF